MLPFCSAHGNSEIPSDKGVLSLRGIGGPAPLRNETRSSDGSVLGAQVLRDIVKGAMRPTWLVTAQQQPAWSRHGSQDSNVIGHPSTDHSRGASGQGGYSVRGRIFSRIRVPDHRAPPVDTDTALARRTLRADGWDLNHE